MYLLKSIFKRLGFIPFFSIFMLLQRYLLQKYGFIVITYYT